MEGEKKVYNEREGDSVENDNIQQKQEEKGAGKCLIVCFICHDMLKFLRIKSYRPKIPTIPVLSIISVLL